MKILSTILQLLLLTGILIFFLLFLSARLSLFGFRSFTVVTGSMEPNIHVGSVVITKTLNDYEFGEIITFKRKNLTVTHRLTGIKNGNYVTKGDKNKKPDAEFVKKTDVIGQVLIVIPYFGRIATFLKSVPGFILFVILPATIFIILELFNIKKELEKQIEAKYMKKIKKESFNVVDL